MNPYKEHFLRSRFMERQDIRILSAEKQQRQWRDYLAEQLAAEEAESKHKSEKQRDDHG